MADPYDKLAPANVATTIRSLPRRLATAWSAIDRDSRSETSSDGFSPAGHRFAIATILQDFDRAIEVGSLRDNPTVDVNFDELTEPEHPPEIDPDTFASRAEKLANRIESLPSPDWSRPVTSSNGLPCVLIDLARHSARATIKHLRALEAANSL